MSPFDHSHQYYVKRSTEHLIRLREAILNAIEESSFDLYLRNDEYESLVKEEYELVYWTIPSSFPSFSSTFL